MKKKAGIAFILVVFIAVASGFWLYEWVLGETEEASGPISAIPLELREDAGNPSDNTGTRDATGSQTYEIVTEGSEVRFIIFEELRGEPVNVLGATDQVAGQLAFNPDDPGAMQMGTIRINARTFVTDEERRDRAMRNRILHTDEHEYITFTPTAISDIESAGNENRTLTFTMTGDLAIRDVVRPETFDGTLEIVGLNTLKGRATATVSRGDYNLVVPNLSFLANVADEVRLEFSGEFRAVE